MAMRYLYILLLLLLSLLLTSFFTPIPVYVYKILSQLCSLRSWMRSIKKVFFFFSLPFFMYFSQQPLSIFASVLLNWNENAEERFNVNGVNWKLFARHVHSETTFFLLSYFLLSLRDFPFLLLHNFHSEWEPLKLLWEITSYYVFVSTCCLKLKCRIEGACISYVTF